MRRRIIALSLKVCLNKSTIGSGQKVGRGSCKSRDLRSLSNWAKPHSLLPSHNPIWGFKVLLFKILFWKNMFYTFCFLNLKRRKFRDRWLWCSEYFPLCGPSTWRYPAPWRILRRLWALAGRISQMCVSLFLRLWTLYFWLDSISIMSSGWRPLRLIQDLLAEWSIEIFWTHPPAL